MGFDLDRFEDPVNEGLLCCICRGVLEDPLQAPCEHTYCRKCIETWLLRDNTCPEDREILLSTELRPLFRYMKNDLNRLQIRCRWSSTGCSYCGPLETIEEHEVECGCAPQKSSEPCGACNCAEVREEFNRRLDEQKLEMENRIEIQRRSLATKEVNLQTQIDELRAIVIRMQQDLRKMTDKEETVRLQFSQLQQEKLDLVTLLKDMRSSDKSSGLVSKML